MRALRKSLLCLLLMSALVLGMSANSIAQTVPGTAAKNITLNPELPDPLTRSAIRDLLSSLDDKEVRKLLLHRLTKQADDRAQALAAQNSRSLSEIIGDYSIALNLSWREVTDKVLAIPEQFKKSYAIFIERRGQEPLWFLFLALVAALSAGFAAHYAALKATRQSENRILGSTPQTLWRKLRLIAARFGLQVFRLGAFVVMSVIVNVAITSSSSPDRYTVKSVIEAIAWIWLVVLMTRFVLAPTQSSLRLCPFDDQTAKFLTGRIATIAAVSSVGFGVLNWLLEFGMTFGDSRLGFWVSSLMHLLIVSTIWQARSGIRNMLSRGVESGSSWHDVASVWPAVAIFLVLAHWLVVEIIVATGNVSADLVPRMMVTLALLVGLPILDHAIRALIASLSPIADDDVMTVKAAYRETQIGLVRCGRVLMSLVLILGVLRLWGVDIFSLAEQGVGARFAAVLIDISLIIMIAYAIGEAATIMTNRQIAIERAAMGIDEETGAMSDGEGGKGESRLATVLPLVRLAVLVVVVVLASFAIISELGVNITPLIAGAGVIGLAIGFGAQTLVKDIISGVFFLIDDAFRKGEYIDIGSVKGTVEKISIRSMQLRHHNGPLNTVPFGEINFITNFSRDWVVMKLPLRLTYETDAEMVRKKIKKLGQEMLEDPVLGPQFLQPLKSQGVIQMEDSAMIMRVKFMTRPGDQWVIRRTVFAKIRELFEREGIRFANREVTVRLADQGAAASLSETERKTVTGAVRSSLD